MDFLVGFGGERKALIFRDEGGDGALSYSSMRLARSSSEVIDTRASRSSEGNWQRRLTDALHNSPSFINSSVPVPHNRKYTFLLSKIKFKKKKKRSLTNRKMKWNGQRRGHGFRHRDNGVCRRDNGGGFCRRS